MSSLLTEYTSDPAAQPILAQMCEGRWRKARDAAKSLCKKDRGRYLNLLIEANLGLAREMHAKGLSKDAGTVADYLETIAPPEITAALRRELTVAHKPAAAAKPAGAGAALAWMNALQCARALDEGADPASLDLAGLDSLVLDPFVPPPPEDGCAQRVAAELAAVRQAAAATGDGRWEEARDALRAVPAGSVFRHWRMFLRGFRWFIREDPATARQCFAKLPAKGALVLAARGLAPELAPPGSEPPPSAVVSFKLALTGQPEQWAAPISAAVSTWKSGKRIKAFIDLVKKMKGVFPAGTPGLPAMLTDSMLPFSRNQDETAAKAVVQIVRELNVKSDLVPGMSKDGSLAYCRAFCIGGIKHFMPEDSRYSCSRLIEEWNRCEGKDPQRSSMIEQWLAHNLIEAARGDPRVGFRGRLDGGYRGGTAKLIRAALEKAVEYDPDNEQAWFSMLEFFEDFGDKPGRNRLLDDLSKRFPENKDILFRTGALAIERKAFIKGLKALQKARSLDPLDRNVQGVIAGALILQAREFGQKKRPQAELWRELEPLLEDDPPRRCMVLSRWQARLCRALVETDAADAEKARREAERLAPSPTELLFAEKLLGLILQSRVRVGWRREWMRVAHGEEVSWQDLAGCLETAASAIDRRKWTSRQIHELHSLTKGVCTNLMQRGPGENPDALLAAVERIIDIREVAGKTTVCARKGCLLYIFTNLQGQVVRNPDLDPRVRLATFLAFEATSDRYDIPAQRLLDHVEKSIHDAAALKMEAVAAKTRALLNRLEAKSPPEDLFDDEFDDEFGDGSHHHDYYDDDDYDDDEYEDDDDYDDGDAFQTFKALIETGDPVIIRSALRAMAETGMSQQEIDEFMASFNIPSSSFPSGKPKARRAPRKARAEADPNQPELPL